MKGYIKRIIALAVVMLIIVSICLLISVKLIETGKKNDSMASVPTPTDVSENKDVSKNFKYRLMSDGSVWISMYIGKDANVIIPSSINDCDVTGIGEDAFFDCTRLKSVKIPEGVTHIGWNAFEGCTNLSEITIPGSVTYVEGQIFYGCSALIQITVYWPDGVKPEMWSDEWNVNCPAEVVNKYNQ